MRPIEIREIASAVGGRLLASDASRQVTGVSTDTRTLEPGDLFVALRGERFDGHQFVAQALSRGAAAALVEDRSGNGDLLRPAAPTSPPAPVIVVKDTVRALGDLAAWYRRSCPAAVIGVTGSNGKTTTKEMIFRALGGEGRSSRAVRSVKSFNNAIGVPLTLFTLGPAHRFCVLEMGTSAPGEIRRLAEIAAPDLGVVTNVSETHLKGLGSREGVAHAKSELIQALPRGGTAVLNADDPLVSPMARLTQARIIRFGRTPDADVFATDIRQTGAEVTFRLNGRRLVRLKVLGEHNALNAAAAIAVCRRLGVSEDAAVAALEAFTGAPMRLAVRQSKGVQVLDDVYNANPQSMRAALATLANLPCSGRRIFVCGTMHELGPRSAQLHREVGQAAAAAGIHLLVTVGDEAREVGAAAALGPDAARHCDTTDEAVALVPGLVRAGDLVLVKGSRVMALERVVEALCA